MNREKLKETYERAREKNPNFCDIITCLSTDGAKTHLDIYRATLAAEVNASAVEASTLLLCEYHEAIQAYLNGDTSVAIDKCYEAIAVLLRIMDVFEGHQELGKPNKENEVKKRNIL